MFMGEDLRVEVGLVSLLLGHLQQGDLLCNTAGNGRGQGGVALQGPTHASRGAVLMEPLPPHAVPTRVQGVQFQVARQGDEGLEEGTVQQLSARVDVGQLVAVLLVEAVRQPAQQGGQRAVCASLEGGGGEGEESDTDGDYTTHRSPLNAEEARYPLCAQVHQKQCHKCR